MKKNIKFSYSLVSKMPETFRLEEQKIDAPH